MWCPLCKGRWRTAGTLPRMLTTAELTAIRTEANAWLPSVATRLARVQVNDGAGGVGSGYVADPATVACRIAPVAGGEGPDQGGAVDDRTTHIVTLPAGTTVEEPDRLVIDGVTYEITLVRKRPGLEAVRRVEVVEAPA
jgi:hypothetical protein